MESIHEVNFGSANSSISHQLRYIINYAAVVGDRQNGPPTAMRKVHSEIGSVIDSFLNLKSVHFSKDRRQCYWIFVP